MRKFSRTVIETVYISTEKVNKLENDFKDEIFGPKEDFDDDFNYVLEISIEDDSVNMSEFMWDINIGKWEEF